MRIAVINGPNLNLLGSRDPEMYGSITLDQIKAQLEPIAKSAGAEIRMIQSNSEGALVDEIQKANADCNGILINPAAYTHTSISIHDALAMAKIPVIEVHLSNIFKREEFRHHSYVSRVATGVISGLGAQGYEFALQAILRTLASAKKR
jgi:3-dehydroquinate dehydratase-2